MIIIKEQLLQRTFRNRSFVNPQEQRHRSVSQYRAQQLTFVELGKNASYISYRISDYNGVPDLGCRKTSVSEQEHMDIGKVPLVWCYL